MSKPTTEQLLEAVSKELLDAQAENVRLRKAAENMTLRATRAAENERRRIALPPGTVFKTAGGVSGVIKDNGEIDASSVHVDPSAESADMNSAIRKALTRADRHTRMVFR